MGSILTDKQNAPDKDSPTPSEKLDATTEYGKGLQKPFNVFKEVLSGQGIVVNADKDYQEYISTAFFPMVLKRPTITSSSTTNYVLDFNNSVLNMSILPNTDLVLLDGFEISFIANVTTTDPANLTINWNNTGNKNVVDSLGNQTVIFTLNEEVSLRYNGILGKWKRIDSSSLYAELGSLQTEVNNLVIQVDNLETVNSNKMWDNIRSFVKGDVVYSPIDNKDYVCMDDVTGGDDPSVSTDTYLDFTDGGANDYYQLVWQTKGIPIGTEIKTTTYIGGNDEYILQDETLVLNPITYVKFLALRNANSTFYAPIADLTKGIKTGEVLKDWNFPSGSGFPITIDEKKIGNTIIMETDISGEVIQIDDQNFPTGTQVKVTNVYNFVKLK